MRQATEQDWRNCIASFAEMFGDMQEYRTVKRIGGNNFMTAEHLGTYRIDSVRYGQERLVEISTGWFFDHRIFGFSVRPDNQEPQDSQMFESLQECHDALVALIEENKS